MCSIGRTIAHRTDVAGLIIGMSRPALQSMQNHVLALFTASIISLGLLSLALAEPQDAVVSPAEVSSSSTAELKSMALNPALESSRRIAALRNLRQRSPELATATGVSLIEDNNEAVAVAAVRLLIEALPSARLPEDMILQPLRGAIWSKSASVRALAAEALAARTDVRSLTMIHQGAQRGLFSELEAIKYFSLADAPVAEKFFFWYLAHGSDVAKSAAIVHLAERPSLRPKLQERYLNDPLIAPLVRDALKNALPSP